VSERDPQADQVDVDGDVEVPEEDAIEQRTDAAPQAEDADPVPPGSVEADEADVAEQSRAVDVDDEGYR
jgi:hypothetical protein